MSTTLELMGLGMAPALADRLGNNPVSVSGNGTAQTGATSLGGASVFLATPTSSNTAFVLKNTISTGRPVWFWNVSSSQTALVYPPSGGTINVGSANASVSVPPLSGGVFQLQNGEGVTSETWGAIIGYNSVDSPTFTNLTLTGQLETAVGTASLTPLLMQAGTLNTSAVAGAIEYDGLAFYGSNAAGARGVLEATQLIVLQAANSPTGNPITAAAPMFAGTNGTTNGKVTLPIGTYFFQCAFSLSSMSATSNSFGFSLIAANSAVIGWQSWAANANKATIATPAAGQSSWNVAANVALATASTATVGWAFIEGYFELTTGGSIAPGLSLQTSASPAVGAGSYFMVAPVGSGTVVSVGNWS